MSTETISFMSNDNVLTVVKAYLMAMEGTSYEDQVALVQSVLRRYRPKDAARLLDIPVQRVYEYRRDDFVDRHVNKYAKRNVPVMDFVKILMLGNLDM